MVHMVCGITKAAGVRPAAAEVGRHALHETLTYPPDSGPSDLGHCIKACQAALCQLMHMLQRNW